jgi:hypothetical protein
MQFFQKSVIAVISLVFLFLIPDILKAQINQTQAFRVGEGFIRIAQPGQVADTLSVIGDLNMPGRYIIPRGIRADELLAHARGPITSRSSVENIDWNKMRVEMSISRYSSEEGRMNTDTFVFRYDEDYPLDLFEYQLRNGDIVKVEVKRSPSFLDWLRVFSTVVSATATTIIVVDRLSN